MEKVHLESHDTLRNGLPTTSVNASISKHPVEQAQLNHEEAFVQTRTKEISALYGIAAAISLNADEALLKKRHRLPGLQSSFLGLEVFRGNDKSFGLEDWAGDQAMSSEYFANLHETMEYKLKM
eukprot:snap_masked-scaffold_2-processed-gene-19.19-mRNA-1 protein AED:0.04 eAED:0.04 QI:0/-1/0/1/-1/1/1/0/123